MSRNLLAGILIISFCAVAAHADLKIRTRTTVMGHTTESTVYIKGARQRSEMSFGGQGGMATITQCDQKRMITIVGGRCSYSLMGSGGETTCPSMPAMPSIAGLPGMPGAASSPPRKGGVITITRTSTDTGERQDMFGYKAKHIRSTMMMVSSPDACHPSNMKMETDGWYADVSTAFSCGDESVRALACGGMGGRPQPQCRDRIVFKGGGGSVSGFPLKQTTTMNSEHGNYTVTTEVVELTSTALDAPLFDMPAGCQTTDIASATGGAEAPPAPDTAATPAPAANEAANPQPTVAPAPSASVAPKTPGVVRVGVVNIKDMSGQNLPTDNLRINLMSEISARHMEAVPLEVETPLKDVEAEARAKECDYILYTVPTQLKEPGTGGLPAASVPRGTTLDPAKFQALTAITVYKVGKPLPEIKDFRIAADGEQFGVNAVMATFEKEGDKLAQQVEQDAHAHAAGKSAAAKTTKPKSAAGTKPH